MGAKLQGAVVAILEERLAVDAQELFRLLSGDPALLLSHWSGSGYSYTLRLVKGVSIGLMKVLSLCFDREIVLGN